MNTPKTYYPREAITPPVTSRDEAKIAAYKAGISEARNGDPLREVAPLNVPTKKGQCSPRPEPAKEHLPTASGTPRTEKELDKLGGLAFRESGNYSLSVMANFARTLERELAVMRKLNADSLAAAKNALAKSLSRSNELEQLRAELASARDANALLRSHNEELHAELTANLGSTVDSFSRTPEGELSDARTTIVSLRLLVEELRSKLTAALARAEAGERDSRRVDLIAAMHPNDREALFHRVYDSMDGEPMGEEYSETILARLLRQAIDAASAKEV